MLLFDSFEKMFGYAYFGVIDYDEFVIPPNGWNFKEYLVRKIQNIFVKFKRFFNYYYCKPNKHGVYKLQ